MLRHGAEIEQRIFAVAEIGVAAADARANAPRAVIYPEH
jgi:hypothetical protein